MTEVCIEGLSDANISPSVISIFRCHPTPGQLTLESLRHPAHFAGTYFRLNIELFP
jgi:hypothetical protein